MIYEWVNTRDSCFILREVNLSHRIKIKLSFRDLMIRNKSENKNIKKFIEKHF
jgi:hypothetical protein